MTTHQMRAEDKDLLEFTQAILGSTFDLLAGQRNSMLNDRFTMDDYRQMKQEIADEALKLAGAAHIEVAVHGELVTWGKRKTYEN